MPGVVRYQVEVGDEARDTGSLAYTDSTMQEITLANGSTNVALDFGGVTTADFFHLTSDRDISVYFASSGTEIPVKATRPLILSGTALTAIYVTNQSGSEAHLQWRIYGDSGASTTPAVSDLSTALANTSNDALGDAMIGYKASGTGAVARTVHSRLADEWVSVKDYGATGDGTTDDVSAINAAFVASDHVFFPPGTYRISSPINATNKKDSWSITGSGAYVDGSAIVADAGVQVMIDLSGSQLGTIENLRLRGASDTEIGLLFARSSDTPGFAAQSNVVENLNIYLESDETANNNNGTVAIYNNGAEIFTLRNVNIYADVPAVFTYTNIFSVSSPFVTHPEVYGMTQVTIEGGGFVAHNGPSIWFDGSAGVYIKGIYLAKQSYNTAKHAIRIRSGPTNWGFHYGYNIEGYSEVWDGLIETRNYIIGMNLNWHMLHDGTEKLIWLDDSGTFPDPDEPGGLLPGIAYSTIRIVGDLGSENAELIGDGGGTIGSIPTYGAYVNGVTNSTIYLYGTEYYPPAQNFAQSISVSGQFKGNTIYWDIDDDPTITTGDDYNYVLFSRNGFKVVTDVDQSNTSIEGLSSLLVRGYNEDAGQYAVIKLASVNNKNLYHKGAIFFRADGSLYGRGVLALANNINASSVNARATGEDDRLVVNADGSVTLKTAGQIGGSGTVTTGMNWAATSSVSDGGTITHGSGSTPTAIMAVPSISGEFVSVTNITSTQFTVAIKKHDNSAGTTQTIYWMALR